MRRILLALALALALAGCADDSDDNDEPGTDGGDGDDTGNETIGPGMPETFSGGGIITASGPVFAVGSGGMAFSVSEGATLIFAEIRWSDPVVDLDLALASPEAGTTGQAQNFDHQAEGGAPGSPDSPHSLTVSDATVGDWQASAFANGAAANTEFELFITVFYGETSVPEGYTGF